MISYPKRQGWMIETFTGARIGIEVLHDLCATTTEEFAAFLQIWLYFGLVHGTLGKYYMSADFLHTAADGRLYLTTKNLGAVFERCSSDMLSPKSLSDPNDLLEYFKDEIMLMTWTLNVILRMAKHASDAMDPWFLVALVVLHESIGQFLKDLTGHEQLYTLVNIDVDLITWRRGD